MPRVPIWISAVCVLAGCSSLWDDLAQRYAVDGEPAGVARRTTVTLAGSNHRGAFLMRGASFGIDEAGVRLAVGKPASYIYPPLRIPLTAVTACSRISWSSGFDTPLWIGDAKVEVVLDGYEGETLAWCERNQIPIVPREVELEWLWGDRDAG
jgi:hypothetical protein